MGKTKDDIVEYWVISTNRLLSKFNLEKIEPEDFTTLMVQATDDILTITVICKSKMLVVNLNESTKKFTGGWKHF